MVVRSKARLRKNHGTDVTRRKVGKRIRTSCRYRRYSRLSVNQKFRYKKDKTSTSRKFIIITQKSTSEETEWLKSKCPKTYQYLIENAELLDKRGSSIYRNRPRFCLFGIGKYSFKRYKVVVSGLYKHTYFTLVESPNGKPMMLDDTCYSLGFDEYDNAFAAQCLLNSIPIQAFIRSLLFLMQNGLLTRIY